MQLDDGVRIMPRIVSILLWMTFFVCVGGNAWALEGDWEVGGSPSVFLLPSRDIYGAGAELYARYDVLDGLSVGVGAGFYGTQQTVIEQSMGMYTLRAGIFYSFDVLQWVPGVGLNVSALFSENELWKWHRDGNGIGVDFDVYVQYRGIRNVGIGVFFSYHLVFADLDSNYMTAGLMFSWYSGMF